MKKIAAVLISIALLSPAYVLAHPGKLDKKGGHVCRTNCKKYHLKTGQYHKHKKVASKSASKSASKPTAKPSGGCDSNYNGCVPIASDVDCAGGSGDGPAYVAGPLSVLGTDVYGLDSDHDGLACEGN